MDIIQAILGVLTGTQTVALISLMAANVILSIIAAVYKNEFELGHLGDFVPNKIWPFIAYLVVGVLAEFVDGFTAVAIAVYVGLTGLYIRGILAAIKSITGLNIPNILSEKK